MYSYIMSLFSTMKNIAMLLAILSSISGGILAFQPSSLTSVSLNNHRHNGSISSSSLAMTNKDSVSTRRQIIDTSLVSIASSILLSNPQNALATREITDASSGELPDLPPEAVRSYLQYRFGLQLAADFYIFDLQTQVGDTDEFGNVSELVTSKGARGGGGGASRIEREYVNPMRIVGLSMPPDVADEIRDSQFAFEKAMGKLTKATNGIRRDLPVEIDSTAVPKAQAAWEEGRVALNSFFITLNKVTGLDDLKVIPPAGPNQFKQYGRSITRYNTFMKKTKLCQNRGGPTLSAAWGQLMVSGYLQDSCGVEPLEGYFFQ